MAWQRCPVCEGCGTVECNFYTKATTVSDLGRVQCRTCGGRGVLRTTEYPPENYPLGDLYLYPSREHPLRLADGKPYPTYIPNTS